MGQLRPSGLHRDSDNNKFCNDLNGSKTPKMSERSLKMLQYFETSKLNISSATLQMATISECRYRWLRVPATKHQTLENLSFSRAFLLRNLPGNIARRSGRRKVAAQDRRRCARVMTQL
jgi:hypothetical protein